MTGWMVAISLAVVPASAATASAPAPADFCATVGAGVTVGTVTDPALVELSGLAASRSVAGVLWTHNDSGDGPRVFALSTEGALLGTYEVAGANAIDWEDIAVGPGPDPALSYLYVGDIGQNIALREPVEVYRAPEPSAIEASGTLAAERIELTYPGGPEDAESMFVDPITGDLVIVTKQVSGVSHVLLAEAAQLVDGATVAMQQVATITIADTGAYDPSAPLALPATMTTAADISPDGSVVLVRTYQQVLAFPRAAGASIADAFAAAPCNAPQVAEPQGEAIAFAADGSGYFTVSEIQLAGATEAPLTFFPITAPVAPTTTTTTEPETTTTVAETTSTALETTAPASSPETSVPGEVTASATTAPATSAPTTTASSGGGGGNGTAIAIAIGVLVLAAVLGGTAIVLRQRRSP